MLISFSKPVLKKATTFENTPTSQSSKETSTDTDSNIPTKKMPILRKLISIAENKKFESNFDNLEKLEILEKKPRVTGILRSSLRVSQQSKKEEAYKIYPSRCSYVNLELKPRTEDKISPEKVKKKNKRTSCLSFFGCFG
jgi:hypothetical protein